MYKPQVQIYKIFEHKIVNISYVLKSVLGAQKNRLTETFLFNYPQLKFILEIRKYFFVMHSSLRIYS